MTSVRRICLLLALAMFTRLAAQADAVWQWSVPAGTGRAFLWVPPDCRQVRAVMVGRTT
jgi:hypothetical protein